MPDRWPCCSRLDHTGGRTRLALRKSISNVNHQLLWTTFKTCGRSYRGAQWKNWGVRCELLHKLCQAPNGKLSSWLESNHSAMLFANIHLVMVCLLRAMLTRPRILRQGFLKFFNFCQLLGSPTFLSEVFLQHSGAPPLCNEFFGAFMSVKSQS